MRTMDNLGAPVQQSMTADPSDYVVLNSNQTVLGIVLAVYPADNSRNRSSINHEDRRGYLHTCDVLVVKDGGGGNSLLTNVIITPDQISGLDNYSEQLPRGSSSLVTGEALNAQFNNVNPFDLDGDWCVVGFLAGNVLNPYVLRWWPHARNPFDPSTSAQVNPNQTSTKYLDQAGRYFKRINGLEFVITKQGDLYVSTYRANSSLKFGTPIQPEDGRFPRNLNDSTGGSVKLWVKPSQNFELDWNVPADGVGVLDLSDDQIPQTNPTQDASPQQDDKTNTYVLVDKDRVKIEVPQVLDVLSKRRILLESSEETKLTVGSDLTIKVTGNTTLNTTDFKVTATGNFEPTVSGNTSIATTGQTTIQSTGPLSMTGTSTVGIQGAGITVAATGSLGLSGGTVSIGAGGASGGPGSIGVSPTGVQLGTGSNGGVVGAVPLATAVAALNAAVASAATLATFDAAAWAGLVSALNAFVAAIPSTGSSTATVGP